MTGSLHPGFCHLVRRTIASLSKRGQRTFQMQLLASELKEMESEVAVVDPLRRRQIPLIQLWRALRALQESFGMLPKPQHLIELFVSGSPEPPMQHDLRWRNPYLRVWLCSSLLQVQARCHHCTRTSMNQSCSSHTEALPSHRAVQGQRHRGNWQTLCLSFVVQDLQSAAAAIKPPTRSYVMRVSEGKNQS